MSALRPEEKASNKEIEQSHLGKRVIGNAATLGASLVGGSALLSRIVPLLSNLIPANLAAKGLSKVSPGLSKFFKGLTSTGYTINEGLDYLRNKINPEQNESQQNETQSPQRDPRDYINENGFPRLNQKQAKQKNLDESQVDDRDVIMNPKQQKPNLIEEEIKRFEQGYRQPQGQETLQEKQNGQGDAALMAALNKILSM